MRRVVSVCLLIVLSATAASAAGVTFCGVGDVMLGRDVARAIKKNGAFYPFENVAALIGRCDIAFLNLECPLTAAGEPLNKRFVFKAAPSAAAGLKQAGFSVASIANNHTIDQGRDAFRETSDTLRENGLLPVGGGSNQREARRPRYLTVRGIRFAFLAFLDMLPEGLTYLEEKPGPAYATIEEIEQAISAARKEADFVIVSMHWGRENSNAPTMNQVEDAHRMIDAGADLVVGHHPHVIQPIEMYKGKPIAYSLGNFVFDNHALRQRQTLIFGCTFTKNKVGNVHVIPAIIEDVRPRLASEAEAKEIVRYVQSGSTGSGIVLKRESGAYAIKKALPAATVAEILAKDIHGIKIVASSDGVSLSSGSGEMLDRFEPGGDLTIKAAELIEDSDAARIYLILGPRGKKEGGRLAVIPVDTGTGKLGGVFIDSHARLNPWKLMKCDVDGDGRIELCVGTRKKTRYDPVYDNRIFVYNRKGNTIYPKWLGSRLMRSFTDFTFKDIDGDSADELITEGIADNGAGTTTTYKWRSFGFSAYDPVRKQWDTEPVPVKGNSVRENVQTTKRKAW